MSTDKLKEARNHLEVALQSLDEAQNTWSECVTSLHLAEVNMRAAQRRMRQCYTVVADLLNGEG